MVMNIRGLTYGFSGKSRPERAYDLRIDFFRLSYWRWLAGQTRAGPATRLEKTVFLRHKDINPAFIGKPIRVLGPTQK
jgi:hypothetical protein